MVHIGIDFDNTIIDYAPVFHTHAMRRLLISESVPVDTKAIRDAIRIQNNGNRLWTELQGEVYGTYIKDAKPTAGVREFLCVLKQRNVSVSIISHKTAYPVIGPNISLRARALDWMREHEMLQDEYVTEENIFFEETRGKKIARIKTVGCTHFIDDLLEVLMHPAFPKDVIKILYTSKHIIVLDGVDSFRDWKSLGKNIIPKYG